MKAGPVLRTIKHRLGPWIPHKSARKSIKDAILAGHRLPPGRILNLNRMKTLNRRILIEESKRHGPIFKALWGRRLWVFVTGLSRCKRFLREHADSISVATIQLEPLVPGGYMRAMNGDIHRKYRSVLLKAVDRELVDRNRGVLERIVETGLARYGVEVETVDDRPHTMAMALSSVARSMLVHIFFGVHPGSVAFDKLERSYDEMGQELLVYHLGEPQKRGFDNILAVLSGRHYQIDDRMDCVLSRVASGTRPLDKTMLGNLVYMVEVGRFDLYSLFRWILKFAADNPDALEQAATDAAFADAFVSETLRLEQSEGLVRKVHRDIEFDGYFIPEGTRVRLCTWEAHKSPDVFPDPFEFRPERFVGTTYSTNEYAPFGLGIHRCPFWEISLATSSIFLQTLARLYTLEGFGDGPAVKNTFHWQPSRDFWVRLQRRDQVASFAG